MKYPVEDEPFNPRGCGCVLIAVVTLGVVGALFLGSILGDCLDDPQCHARKDSVWVWVTPLLVLVVGAGLGALFVRMTKRQD